MMGHKREKKWLEFLQGALPSLCRRLHATFSELRGHPLIGIYSQTKRFGPVSQHFMLHDGRIGHRPTLPAEDFSPTANAIDCCIWFYGSEVYRCVLPFHVLNDHGIHFGLEEIEKMTRETPDEMRRILYTWIQDTIRGELCRRRTERIKEELVAAVWHPDRVAKRLEEGGWEAVEGMT